MKIRRTESEDNVSDATVSHSLSNLREVQWKMNTPLGLTTKLSNNDFELAVQYKPDQLNDKDQTFKSKDTYKRNLRDGSYVLDAALDYSRNFGANSLWLNVRKYLLFYYSSDTC